MKYYLIEYKEREWDIITHDLFVTEKTGIFKGENPIEAFESLKDSVNKYTSVVLVDIKEI